MACEEDAGTSFWICGSLETKDVNLHFGIDCYRDLLKIYHQYKETVCQIFMKKAAVSVVDALATEKNLRFQLHSRTDSDFEIFLSSLNSPQGFQFELNQHFIQQLNFSELLIKHTGGKSVSWVFTAIGNDLSEAKTKLLEQKEKAHSLDESPAQEMESISDNNIDQVSYVGESLNEANSTGKEKETEIVQTVTKCESSGDTEYINISACEILQPQTKVKIPDNYSECSNIDTEQKIVEGNISEIPELTTGQQNHMNQDTEFQLSCLKNEHVFQNEPSDITSTSDSHEQKMSHSLKVTKNTKGMTQNENNIEKVCCQTLSCADKVGKDFQEKEPKIIENKSTTSESVSYEQVQLITVHEPTDIDAYEDKADKDHNTPTQHQNFPCQIVQNQPAEVQQHVTGPQVETTKVQGDIIQPNEAVIYSNDSIQIQNTQGKQQHQQQQQPQQQLPPQPNKNQQQKLQESDSSIQDSHLQQDGTQLQQESMAVSETFIKIEQDTPMNEDKIANFDVSQMQSDIIPANVHPNAADLCVEQKLEDVQGSFSQALQSPKQEQNPMIDMNQSISKKKKVPTATLR